MEKINEIEKSNIIQIFLRSKNYRQYNIPVAKALGRIEYAVLLTDLIDQFYHLQEEGKLVSHIKYGDGLMYYMVKQAYERCAICRDSFDSGLDLFIKLGFIKDSVRFGTPPKRYFRLDLHALNEWLFSNINYKERNSAVQRAETRSLKSGIPQTNEYKNESNNESDIRFKERMAKSDDKKNERPPDKDSSSFKNQKFVSFDPFSYKLRNGNPLSMIMARTLAKKMKDAKESEIIKANVEWYENQIDSGASPLKHEAYLQFAITKNLAQKYDRNSKNSLYAKFMKEENKSLGIKILKSVVQLDKRDGSKYESISLDLPEKTFSIILENFIETQKKEEK